MRIKLVEKYSIDYLRACVRDSLMTFGEEAILVAMHHAGPNDEAERCPNCYDATYKQSGKSKCNVCFGTGFKNGAKGVARVWAQFTDQVMEEDIQARGTWQPGRKMVQTEAFPRVVEHDFVARVKRWGDNHTPLELEGIYEFHEVTQNSLRTGPRTGQEDYDVIGQKAQVTRVQTNSPISQLPIVGTAFPPPIGTSSTLPPGTTMPDTKVVFYPLIPVGPNGIQVPVSSLGFTHVQSTPADPWIIHHNLKRNPDVSVIVDNEKVMPDVQYPDLDTVVISFGSPQTGSAELV